MALIGRITVQPTVARPGETVRVEVFDLDDNPLHDTSTAVSINGTPGALQYLQFPTAGQRRLNVSAVKGGESDQQVALVDIEGSPLQFPSFDGDDIAMIGVTQSAPRPYTAILTLGSSIDTRSPHLLALHPTVSPSGRTMLVSDSLAGRLAARGLLGRAFARNAHMLKHVESRRLVNTKKKLGKNGRPGTKRSTRFATGAVYDLSAVDVGKLFAEVPKMAMAGYEWDFGDGTTTTTKSPTVTHDYFPNIDHAKGIGQFVVTCKVRHAGITVSRTLTIGSAYALCKRTGTIVPYVTAELFAHKRYTMITGAFTVFNVEDKPIVLDRVSITASTEEGSALALPRPFITLGKPITIAAKSVCDIAVNIPFVTGTPDNGQLRYDITGFSVIYAGRSGTYPVRCSATFDIPVAEWGLKPEFPGMDDVQGLTKKPWPWEMVINGLEEIVDPAEDLNAVLDVKTGTLAVAIGPLNDTRTRSAVRTKTMRIFSAVYAPVDRKALEVRATEGRLVLASAGALTRAPKLPSLGHGDFGSNVQLFDGPPPPGFIAEGQICDPDNLTEEDLAAAEEAQLVCQLTDETKDVEMPARWMNARKGDCILSPGGDGIIGGLMLNVSPPQWYSHSGIMTRNYDEITHSTGSKDRMLDHKAGVFDGSDGFEPHVLKWVWPGAVTQRVEKSIDGEMFPDPEYDKSYKIAPFGAHTVGVTHNDQMKMIPPLVVKPDPMQETAAVRTALHAIASDARAAGGRPGVKPKYHYRWYCYTNPQIGLGDPEGWEAGWAAGTRGTCCSSFIWLHAKKHGTALETTQALVTPTDLEPRDVETGAAVRPITPDGLYTYSADERAKAAQWLYDTVYNQAYDQTGWFGEILTDAADDVANQFLNAFANDDADGKDSEAWRDVVPADAVSPDDMLWWDGPANGGLYGYAEPAIYREPRVESYTVSRWKKVLNRGDVHGRVFGESGPVSGAQVQVYEGKSTFSGGDGSYTLTDVPLGSYALKGSKVIDGVFYSSQQAINVNAADQTIDIHLQPPSERYRIAQVFLDFWGRDEETFGSDEINDPGPEYFELELGPDKLINSAHRTYHWGGEVRVEYDITVRLLVNNTIDVQVQGTLYEGTDEETEDLDGQGGVTFQVPVGQTQGATLTITNTDEDDEDAGVLQLSVKNVRNNN